jgi:ATP-dependent Lon protease
LIKALFRRFFRGNTPSIKKTNTDQEKLARQTAALYGLLSDVYGPDKLILKASKLGALNLMRSESLDERVLALQRLVYEDPTISHIPSGSEIPAILNEIEDKVADIIARKTVENDIEEKISRQLQERQEEYVKELRLQILKEEGGSDNPHTLKKFAELEKLEEKRLSRSASEVLRPKSLEEVVGQEKAVRSLLTKIASPYPQHVIVYGPPGVGKTTVARLALEEAKGLPYTPFQEDAQFVEVDGTTLRWDPREVTNPLLGSVHDPIYQGARRDLAEDGIPEPKPGLVTEAHGGILFIDEIGELDPILMNKLLKVLEDKRVTFDSAYYDPSDDRVPKYIRKLFEDGAPADFILIGATTRDPSDINPAIRSRCAEVFFEPLTQEDIQKIVVEAAARLEVAMEEDVPDVISKYTVEGRKATNILSDAHGFALQRSLKDGADPIITCEDVYEAVRLGRLIPYVSVKASDKPEVGRVFGLGVSGFIGSVIEIEAVVFEAREKGSGKLRFNETAGTMAKDSVFNAGSVIRGLIGVDIADYDIHVNVVGGGAIDGPSAGAAVMTAIVSALQGRPARQDVAITGEISIQGKVKPVGGIPEKIYGAKQAMMKKVLIPWDNFKEVPPGLTGIEIIPVSTAEEVLGHMLVNLTSAAG